MPVPEKGPEVPYSERRKKVVRRVVWQRLPEEEVKRKRRTFLRA